jgi:hypothetical protein
LYNKTKGIFPEQNKNLEIMKTQNEKINFSKSVFASVEIKDLEKLGWTIDVEEGDEEVYHVDITVDDEGKTTWCLTNTQKADNGIWEGSDKEETGDDEQTIKDLEKLNDEGKLWNVKTEYYGS